ncbi:MAG: alanine racemase [Firmicutes bacterium]|nr:alanine racemase [Bacillota bacterium]
MDYKRAAAFISREAIKTNIENIRKATDKTAEVMGIVKADAYGHGAVPFSEILLKNGASRLGVAIPEEGFALREAGIEAPILILGRSLPDYYPETIKAGLTHTICSYSDAKKLSETALRCNISAKAHIKLDTGMGRIGFFCTDECADEILKICSLPNLETEGIFTHFALSDAKDKSYTKIQQGRFMHMLSLLASRGINIPVKHWANSGAITDMPGEHLDMVRAGIILYGLYPSDEVDKKRLPLVPVMSIFSRVAYIKELSGGESISYGRTYITESPRKIATVPMGYADGISRLLSNKGRVIIKGKYAPVVGRICMDQFMVDITDIPEVSPGDPICLLGSSEGLEISADELAMHMGTINYEVTCLITSRVPRIFV